MGAAKTVMQKGVEVCVEHKINIKYCAKCQAAMVKAPNIGERALAVLSDGQWHTLKEMGEKAGLLEGENYVDLGRAIRGLRDDDKGAHPVDERRNADDPMLHEYCILSPEAAPAFWKKRAERMAKRQDPEAAELRKQNDELHKHNDELREQVKFLTDYVALLERQAAQVAVPTCQPQGVDVL
jgi:hypothetical protein